MKIKEHREARGWTQATLAKKAHVARVAIGRIEIGHSRPSLELERLAKIFEVTLPSCWNE